MNARILISAFLLAAILLAACTTPRTRTSGNKIEHVILVTLDAAGGIDAPTMEALPTFAKLLKEGAHSFQVESVWPSVTYVAHTTMQTGRLPGAHGVYNDHPLQPGIPDSNQAWFWYRSDIKEPTIFDQAKVAGISTATVLWPVAGGANIDFNFPEIAALKGENQTMKVVTNGSLFYLLDLESRFSKLRKGTSQPELDNFVTAAASYVIEAHKPGLLALHLIEVDDAKHETGIHSDEVKNAFAHYDAHLAQIVAAVERAGIKDSTAIVIASDHSQFDYDKHVRLNILLKQAGLIRVDAKGKVDWDAFLQATGGDCILFAKNSDFEQKALAVIKEAMARPELGIDRIMDRTELDGFGADPSIHFVVEGKPGTHFEEETDGDVVVQLPDGKHLGTHGYAPTWPDYSAIFFAIGPGIRAGADLGPMSLVDVAPTIARLLDFAMPKPDGKVPDSLLVR